MGFVESVAAHSLILLLNVYRNKAEPDSLSLFFPGSEWWLLKCICPWADKWNIVCVLVSWFIKEETLFLFFFSLQTGPTSFWKFGDSEKSTLVVFWFKHNRCRPSYDAGNRPSFCSADKKKSKQQVMPCFWHFRPKAKLQFNFLLFGNLSNFERKRYFFE